MMFLDTAFLKNEEIQLVLEKTVEAYPSKTGSQPITSPSAARTA